MTLQQLHDVLQKEIRLYPHLGIEITSASADRVHFRVSLAANTNHKGTAFGGSLYATAVLAAYSLVLMSLKQDGATTQNIVIQRGSMEYLQPVDQDFEVICELPDRNFYQRFFSSLQRWQKAREELTVRVLCRGQLCAKLNGVFVVKV